jgi:hypothetical protein
MTKRDYCPRCGRDDVPVTNSGRLYKHRCVPPRPFPLRDGLPPWWRYQYRCRYFAARGTSGVLHDLGFIAELTAASMRYLEGREQITAGQALAEVLTEARRMGVNI